MFGVIKAVNESDLAVSLSSFLTGFVSCKNVGRIHRQQMEAALAHNSELPDLRKMYSRGEHIQCVVLSCSSPPDKKRIELSIDPADFNRRLSLEDISHPLLLMAEVVSHEDHGCQLDLGMAGEVFGFVKDAAGFPIGKSLLCAASRSSSAKSRVLDVARPDRRLGLNSPLAFDTIRAGMIVKAVAEKAGNETICDIGSGLKALLNEESAEGESFEASISLIDFEEKSIYITRLLEVPSSPNADILGALIADATVTKVLQGNGIFLEKDGVAMYAHISRLSDTHVDRIPHRVGVRETVRVLDWDQYSGHYLVSLKKSALQSSAVRIEQFRIGQTVSGVITQIEPFGAIALINGHFRALCPATQCTETQSEGAMAKLRLQQKLRFRILDLDISQRRIILTRKKGLLEGNCKPLADYTALPGEFYRGFVVSINASRIIVKFFGGVTGVVYAKEVPSGLQSKPGDAFFMGQVLECRVVKCDPEAKALVLSLKNAAPPNSIDVGGVAPAAPQEPVDLSTNALPASERGSARLSLPPLRQHEDSRLPQPPLVVDASEATGPMSVAKTQEIVETFEKKLIGNSQSSEFWIQYVSTLLKMGEVDHARQIAERSLKTVDSKYEAERFNLWLAYLNLENAFGTSDTIDKVFKRALVYCDARSIYLQLAQIFESSGKTEAATGVFQAAVKKFRQSCKVWLLFSAMLYRSGDAALARKVLAEALLFLPKHKHLKLTCKAAQMEYKLGEKERGRSLFERAISNYPKRLDIWLVYVTMEQTLPDHGYVRKLFERVLSMRLSSKKAKFYFKKYLEFEKSHGNPDSIQHVKDLAIRYVEGR